MRPEQRAELFTAWWEHQRLMAGTRDERKALSQGQPASVQMGHEAVNEVVEIGGTESVRSLADLIDAGPDGDGGQWVGAGPLEDLINAHGDELIDEIEAFARRSASFRQALGSVWLSRGTLTPSTEERLERWIPFTR